LPSLKQHLAAIAVVLDFVNPLLALWRTIDRRSELWRDETKGKAGHASYLAALDQKLRVLPCEARNQRQKRCEAA
jgi:hypothetical protein